MTSAGCYRMIQHSPHITHPLGRQQLLYLWLPAIINREDSRSGVSGYCLSYPSWLPPRPPSSNAGLGYVWQKTNNEEERFIAYRQSLLGEYRTPFLSEFVLTHFNARPVSTLQGPRFNIYYKKWHLSSTHRNPPPPVFPRSPIDHWRTYFQKTKTISKGGGRGEGGGSVSSNKIETNITLADTVRYMMYASESPVPQNSPTDANEDR